MKKTCKFFGLIIFVTSLFVMASFVFSKYVFDGSEARIVSSSKFYFRTDIDDSSVITNMWDGNNNLSFNINIYNYKNSLLFSDDDINYKISYDKKSGDWSKVDLEIRDVNNNIIEDSSSILEGNKLSSSIYSVTLISNNPSVGDIYEFDIILESFSPFSKKIKLSYKITIVDSKRFSYECDESLNKEYVSLGIKVLNNYNRSLKIRYNKDNLLVDKSNNLLLNAIFQDDGNYENILFNYSLFDVGDVYNLMFIKKNDSYNKDADIVITEE